MDGFWDSFFGFFNSVDDVMYYPILIIVLTAAGLYFTVRTRGVQLRLFGTACKLIVEKPASQQKVSSFQALMVSTASRVGTRLSRVRLRRFSSRGTRRGITSAAPPITSRRRCACRWLRVCSACS